MDFPQALKVLRDGGRVARHGWNGKGMWLVLIPGSTFVVESGRPLGQAAPYLVGKQIEYGPHIDIKGPDDVIRPWEASSRDLLWSDWYVVE